MLEIEGIIGSIRVVLLVTSISKNVRTKSTKMLLVLVFAIGLIIGRVSTTLPTFLAGGWKEATTSVKKEADTDSGTSTTSVKKEADADSSTLQQPPNKSFEHSPIVTINSSQNDVADSSTTLQQPNKSFERSPIVAINSSQNDVLKCPALCLQYAEAICHPYLAHV